MGDILRDTLRCSFRYWRRLLPTPALEKLPSRCEADVALDGEPSSGLALGFRRLSLRLRAMCTSWFGSTVGRGGTLLLAFGTRSWLCSCPPSVRCARGELPGEVPLLLPCSGSPSSSGARPRSALALDIGGVCVAGAVTIARPGGEARVQQEAAARPACAVPADGKVLLFNGL